MWRGALLPSCALALLGGCAAHVSPAPPVMVTAAPPPTDDGKSSRTAEGGLAHSEALEELKIGPLLGMVDRQRSIRLLVPDGKHWTRVKFFGIRTLMGLRYGKEHHAVIGVSVQHLDPSAPLSECSRSFEAWGSPFLKVLSVDVARDPIATLPWRQTEAELHTSFATTSGILGHDGFAVAYATYPAWKGACLIVGIAVPAHEDEPRARAVRDRFAAEVLPKVRVLATDEPKPGE